MHLSVIIPTRCCDDGLSEPLQQLRRQLPTAQIIVVEPYSDPPSPPPQRTLATTHALRATRTVLTQGQRGRGTQCNAGAQLARGELLLFLHDDTRLPATVERLIAHAFTHGQIEIACFRLAFDRRHPLLRLYAAFSAFDSFLTSFGDQGILVRRELFERLGGFPNWPLFEDVEFLRRARRQARIKKLPAKVTTSAVRFVENGIIRQQLLNAELMLRFALGADPESLRIRYEQRRSRARGHADL
jgi:rSAM/selenodomain-associated transferase 2